MQVLKIDEPFVLESGAVLQEVEIAYHTYGKLNDAGDNCIWICHALTANSDPLDWWPGLVGPGKVLDTQKNFIVCANMLGSSYGSTNPDSINPATGKPFGLSFPVITVRDIAKSLKYLRAFLGIEKVQLGIGGSMGGQQLLEWNLLEPTVFEKIALLATNSRHSPWGKAFNESQRMALAADPTFGDYSVDHPGKAGLEAARAIAMLSYRNYNAYKNTQEDLSGALKDYRAASYQRYQGQKLSQRFSATSYWSLTRTMDSHDVGRNRGGLQKVLSSINTSTLVISISSDVLFPPIEQQVLAEHIRTSTLVTIESDFGHDGFLVEGEKIARILVDFFKDKIQFEKGPSPGEISFAGRRKKVLVPGCETF